jgi:hypothetical protein
MYTTKAQICIRRDTAANFTSANPTLALGEIAYETDTRNLKVGDGSTTWQFLPYINPFRGTAAAPTSNTVLGNAAGNALQAGAIQNVLIGESAGGFITTADLVTAVGWQAGRNAGEGSTALGKGAMTNHSGNYNVAVGWDVMATASSGAFNTAIGTAAMKFSSAGSHATVIGNEAALVNNASDIIAVGANALRANTIGTQNVAVGRFALGAATTAIATVTTTVAGTGGTDGAKTAIQLERDSGGTMGTYPTVDLTVTSGAVAGTVTVATGGSAASTSTAGGIIFRANAAGIAAGVPADWRCQLATVATAASNTAVGHNAGLLLTTASSNTLVGALAGDAITTGGSNTCMGHNAGGAINSGGSNSAFGVNALAVSTTTSFNTAVGVSALQNNTGQENTGVGVSSLRENTGLANTAVGLFALVNKTTGNNNSALGLSAGRYRGSGTDTLTDATSSVFIGYQSRAAANSETNQVVIAGTDGLGNGSNTTTIGNSSTTGTFIPAGNLTLSSHTFGNANGLIIKSGIADIRIQAADGSFGDPTIGTYANAPLNIKVNSARVVQFQTGGDVRLDSGNLVIGTSGKGIDFSATPGTGTSELLNDYEEGTWTPVYGTTGTGFTTMTMEAVTGRYTKIGRMVTVQTYLLTSNVDITGATGDVIITGLPFTVGSFSSRGFCAAAIAATTAWTAGGTPTAAYAQISDTHIRVQKRAAADGAMSAVVPADMQTGSGSGRNQMVLTLSYFVA